MRIYYANPFEKSYKKLPKEIQEFAARQLDVFRNNPNDPRLHIKALKGLLKGKFSFRVTRNYRVLFAWKDKENVIFYEIGDRKYIYD